jgi:hypothetical protein
VHPYFPLVEGSYSDFHVFEFEGAFNIMTGDYGVTRQWDHVNSPQRITVSHVDHMRKMTYHAPSQPPPPVGSALYEATVGPILGEIGGHKVAQQPPIPLIITTASEGERNTVVSNILHFDDTASPLYKGELHCIHWTKHIGKPWGPWPDTMRTVLLEDNPAPHPKAVYLYVFAKDIGLVDFYRALWDDSGTDLYHGFRYYRIGP